MSGIGVAVLTAVLVIAAGALVRPVGRWLTKHLKLTFAEVVTESVADKFDGLGERFQHMETKLDAVQAQNSAEHGETSKRLTAVEVELSVLTERVTALEPKETS